MRANPLPCRTSPASGQIPPRLITSSIFANGRDVSAVPRKCEPPIAFSGVDCEMTPRLRGNNRGTIGFENFELDYIHWKKILCLRIPTCMQRLGAARITTEFLRKRHSFPHLSRDRRVSKQSDEFIKGPTRSLLPHRSPQSPLFLIGCSSARTFSKPRSQFLCED